MQYILSEEEMSKVISHHASLKILPSKDKLQKTCTKIADEWPKFAWGNGSGPG